MNKWDLILVKKIKIP